MKKSYPIGLLMSWVWTGLFSETAEAKTPAQMTSELSAVFTGRNPAAIQKNFEKVYLGLLKENLAPLFNVVKEEILKKEALDMSSLSPETLAKIAEKAGASDGDASKKPDESSEGKDFGAASGGEGAGASKGKGKGEGAEEGISAEDAVRSISGAGGGKRPDAVVKVDGI